MNLKLFLILLLVRADMKSFLMLVIMFVALIAAFTHPSKVFASAAHIRTTSLDEICNTRTDTVRNVPESLKHKVYVRDNVPNGNHTGICSGKSGCEVDHRVSLELGGSNDITNLMIQPYDGLCNAHQKDALENRLHRLVCSKSISVNHAQDIIYNDWESAFKNYVDPAGCK